MNMQSRNQYLQEVRTEYLKTKSKLKRGELLDEAEKRTKLSRKHLIVKLRPKSSLDGDASQRKKREQYYGNAIKPALIRMWEIFDHACGQRLQTSLEDETDRLRALGELSCSDDVAEKLKKISSATIDRKLKHQKQIELAKAKYGKKIHPLLYQQIPVKIFEEQDRDALGNMQIDLVEHCGASASGEYVNTLDVTDIASGWSEQEAIMGKGQEPTKEGVEHCRSRCEFDWLGIHSDGGTNFINNHLFKYSVETDLEFSRSRPYKKNDNCLVEQKNNTHVRRLVGYLRYDTAQELNLLNDLYRNEWRLYKNFFSPMMKLISKKRIGGRICRMYDKPKTPYQRLMESLELSEKKKGELRKVYLLLNPALLRRTIDEKLDNLYRYYKKKNDENIGRVEKNSLKVVLKKKISVRFSKTNQMPVSVR